MSEFTVQILAIQKRVADGRLDLRPVGEALTGRFDQDFPAQLLRLALIGSQTENRATSMISPTIIPSPVWGGGNTGEVE